MNLITKYKIFENGNGNKLIMTEDFIKSLLEKDFFTKEVIEYFKDNGYPFYPSVNKYKYSYEEDEDKHILHYEFEDNILGILTTMEFVISFFSSNTDFFRINLYLNVEFIKEKNPFKNINFITVYTIHTWDDIFKTTKVGKVVKNKQDGTLISQIKLVLKKVIKQDVFKYGPNQLSIKEVLICYRFINQLEEFSFVKDYTDIKDYPNKKDFKVVKYEDCELKATNPWVYSYGDYIRLYFYRFNRVFILHEQYIYKVNKIFIKIKKEVEDELNN